MPKNKKKIPAKTPFETDSPYFLKLVVYMILGSIWVRFTTDSLQIPIPLGLIAGLILASRDRFKIDRKLEYAVLLMTMFISFWLPLGLEIRL